MMKLLLPLEMEVKEFVSIRRGDSQWVKTEAEAEGTVKVPLEAEWNSRANCFSYYEADHEEDPECPICASEYPCVQEVNVYPALGKILVIHEPMAVKQETNTMPVMS